MKYTIKESNFEEIKHLKSAAARDRVSISDTRNTKWFAAKSDEGKVVAVGAYMTLKTGYRRGKAYWVHPDWRHKGIGMTLVSATIGDAPAEVFTYHPKTWAELGFVEYGKLPNGAAKMRREK